MASSKIPYKQQFDDGSANNMMVKNSLLGDGVAAIFTQSPPNGVLSGVDGQIAIDQSTNLAWMNTDGNKTWVPFGGGGGGGGVELESDGTPVAGGPFSTLNMMGSQSGDGANIGFSISDAGTGTADVQAFIGASGRYLGRSFITQANQASYVPPATARYAVATLCAGGGGGGGVQVTNAASGAMGAGGSSGEVFTRVFDAGAGNTLSVTSAPSCGAGGTAPSGASGGAGGATSIGFNGTTVLVTGGGGGAAGVATSGYALAVGGGVSPTNIGASSQPGGIGICLAGPGSQGYSGSGGGSPFGIPPMGRYTGSQAGNAGNIGYGCGGGGAINAASQAARSGGVGGEGCIVVDHYSE